MEGDCPQAISSDHDLLVRIDERTKGLHEAMGGFVTRKEFNPVKQIVYAIVGVSLAGVLGALIKLVIVK